MYILKQQVLKIYSLFLFIIIVFYLYMHYHTLHILHLAIMLYRIDFTLITLQTDVPLLLARSKVPSLETDRHIYEFYCF